MAKQERIGIVVSSKTNKTRVVAVERRYAHKKYVKTILKTKRYMIHDENNISNCGDIVLIREDIPKSSKKSWVLVNVINLYHK
jgi:small subunit ribosomal protein S17